MTRLWGSYGRGGSNGQQQGYPLLLGLALLVGVGYLLQSGGAGGDNLPRDVQMMRSVRLPVATGAAVVVAGIYLPVVGLIFPSRPSSIHLPTSTQGAVSEEVMAAIQQEVRSELYEKLANQNKGNSGKARTAALGDRCLGRSIPSPPLIPTTPPNERTDVSPDRDALRVQAHAHCRDGRCRFCGLPPGGPTDGAGGVGGRSVMGC